MPKLGLSMTEGAVVEWRVKPGEQIEPGKVIADIETSKIVNELEAHVSGALRRTVVELGVEVPVGALIAVVAEAHVPEAEIDGFVSRFAGEIGAGSEPAGLTEPATPAAPTDVASTAPLPRPSGAGLPESLLGNYDRRTVFASHHAHKLARRLGLNLAAVAGTGRRGRISRRDLENAVEAAGGATMSARPSSPSTAPPNARTTRMAKRLADERGIDLAAVTPTGRRGRITKGDILRYLDGKSAEPSRTSDGSNPFQEETLDSARRVIASRLSDSKREAPHFRLSVDVIIDKLFDLRRDIEQGNSGIRVPVDAMLVRAAALALVEHADVNIQFDGRVVRRFAHADVAVAVALDKGLVTPIVRNADQKTLVEIAREVTGLVERSRTGKLMPDEFQGGTFTLSNLGMFGIKSFDAIINPPQAAIMAIGRAERRLYVGEEDSGRVATFMTVTMSCDHRVIDGATGARFLQTFKEILQRPAALLIP